MAGKRVWISATQWVFDDAVKHHDPNATKDYALDLAHGGANDASATDPGWLQGDTIDAVTWSAPDDLTLVSDSHTTTTATVWISGGTAGSDHLVTAHVTTAAGRENDFSLLLRVREQ